MHPSLTHTHTPSSSLETLPRTRTFLTPNGGYEPLRLAPLGLVPTPAPSLSRPPPRASLPATQEPSPWARA